MVRGFREKREAHISDVTHRANPGWSRLLVTAITVARRPKT